MSQKINEKQNDVLSNMLIKIQSDFLNDLKNLINNRDKKIQEILNKKLKFETGKIIKNIKY